ncbi:hypothetical protein FE257_006946 [Aspergillus nanangensis]|uniref:Xylanolytic transcriptional activator regulatory domain-containing protein n=1 Tax=Aspergillus nanangensis TaxID=2582783 RepID=A0AAD4GUL8_ASPNN|nr:hypothetical protein FE257_006946 [Aspergillus nanangensis]
MDLPAKRRKLNPSAREIGLMRKSHQAHGSATFLGSSSGIHFIRIVYNAFARRSAHLTQTVASPANDNLVPGEDDQLQHQSPAHPDVASSAPLQQNELWMPHELDHSRSSRSSVKHHQQQQLHFDTLVQLTRSYFDHWHPLFPYVLGPAFLRILETLSQPGGSIARLSTPEAILVRSIVSISLMDRRQTSATTTTTTTTSTTTPSSSSRRQKHQLPPVPADLVFRTVDQAMRSLHTLFCDPPTIAILQAAFSVQLFLASLLRLNAASRIGGVVTRTAFHLGLHRCPARFFSCFTADEAAALGVPLSIRDDDVDVCYPGMEAHGEGQGQGQDDRLRLLTHLAKFARVRGLIVELRNKSILHSQESSITATQVNGELTQWWNEVYDDVYQESSDDGDGNSPASLAPLHRLLLIVLRYESVISMNRPLLATDAAAPEYKTALQVCIESSRSLIVALRRYLPGAGGETAPIPLVWPSFTWAVWMSCLILVYAAWEGEFPVETASRYTKSGLTILQNLALRDNSWPQTCIEALRDLESALSHPPPPSQPPQQPPSFVLPEQQRPPLLSGTIDTGLGLGGEQQQPGVIPPTALVDDPSSSGQFYNPSAIFGDSSARNNTVFNGFSADAFLAGDTGEGILSDLWTVADGPWLIQENYDMNHGFGGL